MTPLILPLLLLASKGGQSTEISFICRAEPMSRLVIELGKTTGLSLSVSKSCANDVIAISAPNVRTSDLLAEIAKVDAGHWSPTATGFAFSADESARRAEERLESRNRIARFQKQLADAVAAQEKAAKAAKAAEDKAAAEQAKKDGKAGDTDVEFEAESQAPSVEDTNILKLLRMIDPSELDLLPDSKLVFATRPNQMQRQLPQEADELIQEIITVHNASLPPPGTPIPNDVGSGDAGINEGMKDYVARMMRHVDGYAKADLVISTSMFSKVPEIHLNVYDAKGEIEIEATSSLRSSEVDDSETGGRAFELRAGMPMPQNTAKDNSAKIELSTDTVLFNRSMQFETMLKGGLLKMSPEAWQLISNPEVREPLGLMPTDALFALAKVRKMPMVAVVPDEAVAMFETGTTSLAGFEQKLKSGSPMVERDAGGWIEIKPETPAYSRDHRTPRSALGKFMRAAGTERSASLDEIAAYATSAPSPMEPGISQAYVLFLMPSMTSFMMDGLTSWDVLRIYGELDPVSKQTLLGGGHVPLEALSPTAQSSLVRLVFGPMGHLSVGNAKRDSPDIFGQLFQTSMGNKDYKDEPTEVLPTGIPGGGFVSMAVDQEPCFQVGEDGGLGSFVVGCNELALFTFSMGMMEKQPGGGQRTEMFEKMKMGQRTVYHLNFRFNGNVHLDEKLNENHVPKDAELVSIKHLPASIQSRIDKVTQAMKKMGMADATNANGPTTPPPPPR